MDRPSSRDTLERRPEPGADGRADGPGRQDVVRPKWLDAIRRRVVRLPGGLLGWRIGIAVVGLLVVAGGVVLLPLPGPGWVIIFLGLGLWASEFRWAGRLLQRARAFAAASGRWYSRQPRWRKVLLAVATAVLVAAVVVAGWEVYRSR